MFSLPNFLNINNVWNARQDVQIVESTFNTYQRILPAATDTQSASYNRILGSFLSNGTWDAVHREGFNLASGGGLVDALKPMIGSEEELDFNPGDGQRYAEGHVLIHQRIGGPLRRIISTYLSNTNAPTVNNHLLNFTVQRLSHFSADDAAPILLWSSDPTNGFLTYNVPIGTSHTDVAKSHLVLNGPAGQTANFISCKKNAADVFELGQGGELTIRGNNSGSGGGGLPMLEVRNRSLANGGGPLLNLLDDAGGVRLFINSGTTDTTLINSRGRWQHRGGSFEHFNADGSVKQFEIQADGKIRTNQTSAGGPAGAVVGKMPIYDTSLTLIGYMEIKALV